MSESLSRLAAVCREHLLREKILLAPSLAIGHQIADAIAHSGTPWVNLRVETIRTLADAVAGFALAADGLTVLSRAQALALIERACDRVLDSSSYFAALADRPGLHRAIQKSIDDLRHASVLPSSLRERDFEDSRKGRDLSLILSAYEEEMRKGKYVDRFGVLARATAMVSVPAGDSSTASALGTAPSPAQGVLFPSSASATSSSRPPTPVPRYARHDMTHWGADALWLVVDDVELTHVEERFLKALAGEFEIIADGSPAKSWAAHRSPAAASGDAASGEAASIAVIRAVGEENEVRGALRAILGAGETFDDAEIVYTTRDPYLPLMYELAAEYEVPATFAEGVASYFTRPGQACLAFLRWIGEGWHATELRTFAGAHTRVLRKAAIGWGRDRYLPRIDALIAELEARDEPNERTIQQANDAREFVEQLLRVSEPVAHGDVIDIAAAARAARDFVERFGITRNEVDAMAKAALLRLFDELAAIGSATAHRAEVARRLADAVRELHVSASNPRPGFLHVAPVRAGGWAARSRLFVVGLDDERHPGSNLQDPIILDTEREAIGIPIVGDRPQRTTEQFRRLLARAASREITLSYAMLSLKERRERFPPPELPESNATAGFVDPQPLSNSEWWLGRRFLDGDPHLRDAILAAYPNLAAGAEAEAARDSDGITKWDGKISASADELDPRLNGKPYSVSRLEMMAGCPYRYFLDQILRVRALEELEYEPDTWLQPNEFGTMLHGVLETTMNDLGKANTKPSLAFLAPMKEIAEEALRDWRSEIPPPSEAAFERRRTELLDSCDIFLRNEEINCGDLTPKHFELPFNDFRLPLGGGKSVTLRGRIDRVDYDEARDEWHVWDYKSGSTYQFERGGQLQCGTKIQHAIYARAVESLVGGRVTKSGYFFPTPKGAGLRMPRECTDAELKNALNLLFDTIRDGYFPHGSEDACKFCDFQSICGGARLAASRSARKTHQPWLKLQGVK